MWEAEHPEEAAKERAEFEAWAEQTRSIGRAIGALRTPEQAERKRREIELKLHAERCATCDQVFGANDVIYRRRAYGGIEGLLLPFCDEHRCPQDTRHNKDAPTGTYYPGCRCDNGWDKPEPCEFCQRLVSFDLRTHPANFTRDYTTPKEDAQRRRWVAEIRKLPVDEQREAWRELPREGRIVRTFCSDGCKRSAASIRARENRPERASSRCGSCDREFTPSRADSLYCSSACRQRAYRDRKHLSVHLSEQDERAAL